MSKLHRRLYYCYVNLVFLLYGGGLVVVDSRVVRIHSVKERNILADAGCHDTNSCRRRDAIQAPRGGEDGTSQINIHRYSLQETKFEPNGEPKTQS
jgi:hypothetical protein